MTLGKKSNSVYVDRLQDLYCKKRKRKNAKLIIVYFPALFFQISRIRQAEARDAEDDAGEAPLVGGRQPPADHHLLGRVPWSGARHAAPPLRSGQVHHLLHRISRRAVHAPAQAHDPPADHRVPHHR